MTLLLSLIIAMGADLDATWKISFEEAEVFPSWKQCTEYTRIAVSDEGRVLIGDTQSIQLALFGADGKLIKKVSRKGEGPGEFSRIGNLGWLDDEKVFYVKKFDQPRFSIWSHDGEFIDEVGYTLNGFDSAVGRLEKVHFKDKNNILLLNSIVGNMGSTPEVVTANFRTGEFKRLLRIPALAKDSGYHDMSIDRHWVLPWDPSFLVGFGKNFFVSNYSDSREITVTDFTGKKLHKFELKVPAVPLSEETHTEVVDEPAKYGPRILQFSREHSTHPDFWPFFNKILVDDQDHIWVSECRDKATDVTNVHELDKTGKEIAIHKVNGIIVAVKNKQLYVLSQDEEAELFLSKYSL